MELMHITDSKWEVTRRQLCESKQHCGIFVVTGSSIELASEVGSFLDEVQRVGYHPYYFLLSGSRRFYVPCYLPLFEQQATPDILDAYDVLRSGSFLYPTQPLYTPHQAILSLKQAVISGRTVSPVIILECLTTLQEQDLVFLTLLLRSTLTTYLPILLFVHKASEGEKQASQLMDSIPYDLLYAMYMCGGRLEKPIFDRLLHAKGNFAYELERYVISRRTSNETWFSYRDKYIAQQVDEHFQSLTNHEIQKLAKNLVQILPAGITYPLFSITAHSDDTDLMLSKYSLEALKATLIFNTRGLLVYFRKLRVWAKKEKNADLLLIATVNYIAMLLFVSERNVQRIYKLLHADHYDDYVNMILRDIFFALGQRLSQGKDPRLLSYASDCYQQCSILLEKLSSLPSTSRKIFLASVANGKALIALKQGKSEEALRLECAALSELNDIGDNSDVNLLKALLHTHIGDLLMRLPDKVIVATTHYEKAHQLAIAVSSLEARLYIVPKLVRAYSSIQRYQAAAVLLEELLSAWKQEPECKGATRTTTDLKIKMQLAQTYLSLGQRHNSAVYYLDILLDPDQVTPAVLRGIASNLRQCLPQKDGSFWIWVENLLSEQERHFAEASEVREMVFDHEPS